MNPERWQQIERIYHGAFEQNIAQREKFLVEACGNDNELRQEIEMLLSKSSEDGKLDRTAWQAAPDLLADAFPAELKPDMKVRPYRIDGLLGAGGTGEV